MSPETQFDLVRMDVGGHPVLFVYGELDVLTAPLLHEALTAMTAEGETTVFVDLANVTFIDSTGLTALVVGHRHFDEAGGELRLVSVTPVIANLFAITGLDERFGIDAAVTRSAE
jgi:anti-sigma B factor antagonist